MKKKMREEYRGYEIYEETDKENEKAADYCAVMRDSEGNVLDEIQGHADDHKNYDFIKTMVDIRLEW